MPSASICCWPPLRSAADASYRSRSTGNVVKHLFDRRWRRASPRLRPTGEAQVLADRQRSEHALAARHLADAQRGDLVGRRVGDVAAVEHDRTAVRLDHTADRLQQRALAGAVGAEQGDDLAFFDVDVDTEQHLPAVVSGVDAAHQQQVAADPAGVGRAPRCVLPRLATPGRCRRRSPSRRCPG